MRESHSEFLHVPDIDRAEAIRQRRALRVEFMLRRARDEGPRSVDIAIDAFEMDIFGRDAQLMVALDGLLHIFDSIQLEGGVYMAKRHESINFYRGALCGVYEIADTVEVPFARYASHSVQERVQSCVPHSSDMDIQRLVSSRERLRGAAQEGFDEIDDAQRARVRELAQVFGILESSDERSLEDAFCRGYGYVKHLRDGYAKNAQRRLEEEQAYFDYGLPGTHPADLMARELGKFGLENN